MGLMRRVESRVERAVGAEPKTGQPRQADTGRSAKGSKLLLEPAELARRLVKELEDHKAPGPSGTLVPHYFTVYLCPADHARLREREEKVLSALERHLSKHARARKYQVLGDISVRMVMDADLAPGYFGILAERVDMPTVAPPEEVAVTSSVRSSASGSRAAAAVTAKAAAVSARAAEAASSNAAAGTTKVIGPGEAAELGLARQTIVLKAGNRVREFHHGRVILGRARDVDFRIDDPNVSRRHAAIFWADGGIVVQDLDSTNGTLVNGYPVTDTVLQPGDVVAIGDCRITVETR